ncbi:MAG: triose-phosphate isomerase [Candidatus Nanosyncoccaceae bacterium]|jgi:triosephosphate isomerase
MTKNRPLIVGNWKMNFNMQESSLLLERLSKEVKIRQGMDVVLAPSLFALQSLSLQINRRQFKLAAQNFYWRDMGSFTGEVSIAQLRGIVDYALVGHSDRRHLFNESDRDIRAKVQAAIRSGVKPILCVGETIGEKTNGETRDAINDQLIGGLANVTSEEIADVAVAYEPVWAIGTGESAMPDDVAEAAKIIRYQIKELYGAKAAEAVRVLYGGSATVNSADDYLRVPGIDGLVVGALSLNPMDFAAIVEKAYETFKESE